MRQLFFIIFTLVTCWLFSEIRIDDIENSSIWSKRLHGDIIYYTKKDNGKVPILCFHKIGSESRYEITPRNFENFLIYLIENNFYPLSDKEFLLKDFSMVPTGYIPIVLGADDASEGNFIYKTVGDDNVFGSIDDSSGKPIMDENSMVYMLEKYIKPVNNRINFTFYISFNGIPFRQTGGQIATGEYYRGISLIGDKFNYLLDNFIVGIHTVTHPITKETSVVDFKWEIDEFYNILYSYVGDRIELIDTLAYPYGCAQLKPEMRLMLEKYNERGMNILGGFDFDGYFSHSPFGHKVDTLDVSRLGVDNQNIQKVYGFLESVSLFKASRVIVVKDLADLDVINNNSHDYIIVSDQ